MREWEREREREREKIVEKEERGREGEFFESQTILNLIVKI